MAKPLKVRRTRIARAKIKEIYAYSINQWGEAVADKYIGHIENIIQQAAKDRGGLKRKSEYSKRFTYSPARQHLVFFDVKEDTLFVVTVFHAVMNIKDRMAEEMADIHREINEES